MLKISEIAAAAAELVCCNNPSLHFCSAVVCYPITLRKKDFLPRKNESISIDQKSNKRKNSRSLFSLNDAVAGGRRAGWSAEWVALSIASLHRRHALGCALISQWKSASVAAPPVRRAIQATPAPREGARNASLHLSALGGIPGTPAAIFSES